MKTLNDLKVYNQVDGWKNYDIHGLSDTELKIIYQQLCNKYDIVKNHVGRFIGTAEYYGYFQCKKLEK